MVRVDLDSQTELANRYNVSSVPTFIILEQGKESARVTGANVSEIVAALDEAQKKSSRDLSTRHGNGERVDSGVSGPLVDEIALFVPKGFEWLNLNVFFGDFESLNLQLLYGDDPKALFKLDSNKSGDDMSVVYSDADSQILFYVPLANISKVHSIFVKLSKSHKYTENCKLDEEEIKSETQLPNLVKIWPNHTSVISFDEADGDQNAAHVEKLDDSKDGWHEIKLKYVRFQKVQSLTIFFDGDDEDSHTIIVRIVLIGVNGEAKVLGTILNDDDDE